MSDWIEWKGERERPVPAGERVDVRWLDGEEFYDTRAGDWAWEIRVEDVDHDGAGVICAYRRRAGA
jgi:hypothetical protein